MILPLVTGVFLASVLAWQVLALLRVVRWVDHTNAVISQMNVVARLMIDAETGQRGYWLTRRRDFLAPYLQSQIQLPLALKKMRELVRDNPSQQQLLHNIESDFDRWQSLSQAALGYRVQDLSVAAFEQRKTRMDLIRRQLAAFLNNEQSFLHERSLRADVETQRLLILIAVLALLGTSTLGFVLRRWFARSTRHYQRALNNLEENRRWLHTTLHSIGDAVLVTDKDARILFMNPVAEALTQWPLPEARAMPLAKVLRLVNQETRRPTENPVHKVIAQGVVLGLANHTVLIGRDGQEIPIDDSAAPIRDENGNVAGVVMVFRDVSERYQNQRVERLLADASHKLFTSLDYKTTLARVAQVATEVICDWCVIYLLEREPEGDMRVRVVEYEGRDAEKRAAVTSYIGRHRHHRLGGELVERVLTSGQQQSEEGSDGRFRLALPMRSLEGPRHLMGVIVYGSASGSWGDADLALAQRLTDQSSLAVANARLYQTARDAIVARDTFLSIASHELKTPLTSLKLQAQVRQRHLRRGQLDAFAPERLIHMVETDERLIERLARLVDDMLDISRIQSGKLTIDPERFDLCELVREVLDRSHLQLNAAGSIVHFVPGDPVIGEWDRFRMEQVFLNLLTNAIRYGEKRPISVRCYRQEATAYLVVQDQGRGVAAENQGRIFRRFERAIARNEVSGLGLGLYIAKEIVERHRGHIHVKSALGEGATFTVELPLLTKAALENLEPAEA